MSPFFQHPQALVETERVGARTRVWAFAHVLPGAAIGEDCNICDHVFIENDVTVGDRVTVKCGVQLWDGVRLEDDVFVGPNVTFTNDPMPRSQKHLAAFPVTLVRRGASLGANATILPGVTIGQYAMVGAGSVVARSVPPYAVVVGNPAHIVRYVDQTDDGEPSRAPRPRVASLDLDLRVRGVRLFHAPIVKDLRGNLSARESGKGLPFVPARVFAVFDVPSREVRGEHAHRVCEQLLVCLRGSVSVVADDGDTRQEIELATPELGLYLPPMVWGVQYKYSADALLLVYASHPYDPDDYIRSYDEFVRLLRERTR
jgi:UDP-2-acetamido-3-amino-2,3-dideoxy-glucuronate N-acetyltransferase